MRKVDSIGENKPQNPNKTGVKTKSKKILTEKQKSSVFLNQQKIWFFSVLAAVIVLVIFIADLKINWQRFNNLRQETQQKNTELDDLKSQLNEIFNRTSSLIEQVRTPTTSEQKIITTYNTSTATLTEELIKEITEELINQETITNNQDTNNDQ